MAEKWKHIAELWATAHRHEIALERLYRKENDMSEQFDAIKASVQTLSDADGYLLQQFADLKSKVDGGEVVSKQDLDDLQASLTSEVDRVHTAVAVADPEDPTGGTDEQPDPVATTPSEPTDDSGSVVVNDPTTEESNVTFGSGGVGPSA